MTEHLTEELTDLLGEDGFYQLTEAYAGTRLYVPGDIARSELPSVIGAENARRLSNVFPGGYIRIPLARSFRAARYRLEGLSNRDIARRLGLSEGGVDKLFAREGKKAPRPQRSKKDTRQIDMFD